MEAGHRSLLPVGRRELTGRGLLVWGVTQWFIPFSLLCARHKVGWGPGELQAGRCSRPGTLKGAVCSWNVIEKVHVGERGGSGRAA